MKKSNLYGAVCACAFSLISIPSHAELIDNGGGLIYDTELDITWAQPEPTSPPPGGFRTWDDANTWAADLMLGGVSGWRLPYASVAAGVGPLLDLPVDCTLADEADCRDNEMGYMFYYNLSGTFGEGILASGDPDLALFPDLDTVAPYWTGTRRNTDGVPEPIPDTAWLFYFASGEWRDSEMVRESKLTWAVHEGNVGLPSGDQPPVADANGPYTGEAGVAVSFDGSASNDTDGTIETYEWDSGDSNTGSGATPMHTYATAGVYNVTLTVTDDDGLSDSAGTQANIDQGNQLPVADANGPYTGEIGVAVSFDGSASSDPDGTIETYDWDFGDGNTGSGETTTHTYATADIYTVTLTVTDNEGLSDSNDTTASIGVGNQPPVADANGPYGGDVGASISFDGNGSEDPDGTIVSWAWRFGDGMTDTGPTPTHSYSEAGKYFVLLTVTDDQGVPDSTLTFADIGPVDLSGSVEDAGGTPLCALVLASGQFEFSCNPNGPFSLTDLPRQTDGTVKRQVYVDGFFPNVETLTGSADDTVVMTRAGTCPDYNSFPDPSVNTDSAGKRIDVSGTVLLQNSDIPVCAMALGNGQFGFTCDGTGTYSANIPLDANGQYKLQVYADGFAPMVQRFDEFTPDVEVRLARAAECQ